MTTKAYLGQARFLDMRIKSKIQQIDSLRELATSCTAVLSDMPRNPNHGASKVESCVMKIIEVQEGLQDDINALVELKKEIMATIHAVEDVELQTLLEKRYLCFLSWERIAVEMHYSIQHIYRMHETALDAAERRDLVKYLISEVELFPREEQKTQKRFVKAIAYKFPIEQKVLTQFDECGASVETVVLMSRVKE